MPSPTTATRVKLRNPSGLLLPPELIHLIAYRSPYTLARKFRLTCFWLRDWCKEADIRQYLLGPRRTWIWAAFEGRVDVLERIEAEGAEGDFAYCEGKLSRWEVALRIGAIRRHTEVVEYTLRHQDSLVGSFRGPRDDGPQLLIAVEEEPDVHRALSPNELSGLGPLSIACCNCDFPIVRLILDHGTTFRESSYAVRWAVNRDNADMVGYLIDWNPHFYLDALVYAAQYASLNCLQSVIDCKRSELHHWDLQMALIDAAVYGQNSSVKLLLQPGNRELNPQLPDGKATAFYLAMELGDPDLVPDLLESDADLVGVLEIATTKQEPEGSLEKLLKWIAKVNENSRRWNPFIVPVASLIFQAIEKHGASDRRVEAVIPMCLSM
ncbi:hypothetical protein HK097_008187 [Rhizophlyctis rosea]|uniref:Uncharacterized protein n=1 Tax=Rhizophlyctis rosea TaxID=64517 RepID=A0AAD5X5F5_9FUNG|nr:hypothetical protein HK097_008187 [Rhizophlyctis rosea]